MVTVAIQMVLVDIKHFSSVGQYQFSLMVLQAQSGIQYSIVFDQDTCTRKIVWLSLLITVESTVLDITVGHWTFSN